MTEARLSGVQPIILDCDPGHDDALAILLALARPEVRLLGITTVAGNSTLDNTTRNALSVLTLVGRAEVPVAAGADRPLTRPLATAPHVHGSSGLEGADLPAPAAEPLDIDAVEFTARSVADSSQPLTLVATGPLTNIATFQQRHPDLFERVAHVCLMGGSIGEGNITPAAEFNIWVDPEAAAIVFDSGRPLTMIGLDVTHQALFRLSETRRLRDLGTRTSSAFADLLDFFARFHQSRYGWDGSPIHDAVAVARLCVPDLVRTRTGRVDVDTRGDLTRGRTIVAFDDATGRPPNAEVGLAIDRSRFVRLLIDAIAAFP